VRKPEQIIAALDKNFGCGSTYGSEAYEGYAARGTTAA
jgi:hypothetical protein